MDAIKKSSSIAGDAATLLCDGPYSLLYGQFPGLQ